MGKDYWIKQREKWLDHFVPLSVEVDSELLKEFEECVRADYNQLGEEVQKELPFEVFLSIEFNEAFKQWTKKQEQKPKSIKPILDKQRRRAKKTLKEAGIFQDFLFY